LALKLARAGRGAPARSGRGAPARSGRGAPARYAFLRPPARSDAATAAAAAAPGGRRCRVRLPRLERCAPSSLGGSAPCSLGLRLPPSPARRANYWRDSNNTLGFESGIFFFDSQRLETFKLKLELGACPSLSVSRPPHSSPYWNHSRGLGER
jgi:hypothetical protein